MGNSIHNPLPASLSSECQKAAAILNSFINPKLKIDGAIPHKIFKGAKGIAIFTALRSAFLGSGRFGSGLVVARLPNGDWSAPSAVGMAGLGAGGQFGIELTDFVFVLTTDAAVNTFMQAGSATLGVNISIAFGPIGRSAEAGGLLGTKGGAGVFAYSKTRGLYGGITLEGGFIVERPRANKKFYGRKVEAAEILTGRVVSPSEAGVLMDVLNREVFVDEAAEIASESRALDAQTTGVIAEGSDEQPRSDPVPVAEVPSESPAEERSAEERSAEMDAQTDEVVAPAELSAESPADERPAELAAQTNEVVTGGSGQQPQSDSPPAAVQTPATKQVVESAPQLPALSNFEDLDVAHESKVQGSLPGDDQGLTGERVAQRETQA